MQIDPVGAVLDMTQISDRLHGVFCVVSMLSIIRKLLTFAPMEHERVELCIPIKRDGGVTVMVNGKTAVKEIPDCDEFFMGFGTTFLTVQVRQRNVLLCFMLSFKLDGKLHTLRWLLLALMQMAHVRANSCPGHSLVTNSGAICKEPRSNNAKRLRASYKVCSHSTSNEPDRPYLWL